VRPRRAAGGPILTWSQSRRRPTHDPLAVWHRTEPSCTWPVYSIMANIGSVFLGDVQRNRLRSSGSTPASTPPSSPPPISLTSRGATHSPPVTTTPDPAIPDSIFEQGRPTPHPHMAPEQSLELRIRWLEAILYGAKHDESLAGFRERHPGLKRGETVARAAEHAYQRMNDIATNYDVLRRFIGHCKPIPTILPTPSAQPITSQTSSMRNT
jgi:hypothetical protein